MALRVMATGGLYLGGGLPPRILSRLQKPDFLDAMCYKGRFRDWLAKIPVSVILDPKAALHGAAWDALDALGEPLHGRCLDIRVPSQWLHPIVQVVDGDHDDVGTIRFGGSQPCRRRQDNHQEQRESSHRIQFLIQGRSAIEPQFNVMTWGPLAWDRLPACHLQR